MLCYSSASSILWSLLFSNYNDGCSEPSGDFDYAAIGEPIMQITLEPGDMLYFPRGTIHEVVCLFVWKFVLHSGQLLVITLFPCF